MRMQESIIQQETEVTCNDNRYDVSADGHAVRNVSDPTPDTSQNGLPAKGETTVSGQKNRGAVLLGVGCVTSPCCTPLVVPLAISLLAGTPLAAFLAQYAGWVYAVLTLVSVVSLFLGVRHVWPGLFVQPQKPPVSTPDRLLAGESQDVPAEMET